MSRLAINLVTYNSERYIKECLDSIFSQSFRDWQLLVIDNNSTDDTVKFIEQNYPKVYFLRNKQNLGFAKAQNQGIKLSKSEYILSINPDVILDSEFLEKLVNFADSHSQGASFGGKVLRFHFSQDDLKMIEKTRIIDSTGLKILKSRRVVERGAGEKDREQYHDNEKVFGISGGIALYRRKALDEIKYKNEYFDENFFMYKEDIDLSWRLQLLGWQAFFINDAEAYHCRAVSGSEFLTPRKIVKSRKGRAHLLSKESFKNHYLMLLKNELFGNLFFGFLSILWFEIKKIVYIVLFEPYVLGQIFILLKQVPLTLRKRRQIMQNKKVDYKFMEKWFE